MTEEKTQALKEQLDKYERALLHIEDTNNRHIDLGISEAGLPQSKDVYLLHAEGGALNFFDAVKEQVGKGPSVIIKDSALLKGEQDVADPNLTRVSFSGNIVKEESRALQKQLSRFIEDCYKDVREKGNNPMFLTLGAVRWKIDRNVYGVPESVVVTSPIVVFPIKLIRGADQAIPVKIEFVDDEIYINESFCRLFKERHVSLGDDFPLPVGYERGLEDARALDLKKYFADLTAYVEAHRPSEGETLFEFLPDLIAVSKYTHEDICMYRDIRRNEQKILSSPLIRKIFAGENETEAVEGAHGEPRFVLRYDSVQQEIAQSVVSDGECVKVQGPPGTGKTQTIANMIAAAMYGGKRVLFVSRKTPALEEVYDKLPKEVSRFVLLIGEDTETASAKMNKNSLQKDLRDTLRFTLDDVNVNEVKGKDEALRGQVKKDIADLSGYYTMMFTDVLKNGYTFYDAIVNTLKTSAPIISFADPSARFLLKADIASFFEMNEIADTAGSALLTATENFAFLPSHSPHFGVKEERTHVPFEFNKQTFIKVRDAIRSLKEKYPAVADLSLFDLECVSRVFFDDETMEKFLSVTDLKGLSACMQNAAMVIKDAEESGIFEKYKPFFESDFFDKIGDARLTSDEAFDCLSLSSLEEMINTFDDHVINRIRKNKAQIKEILERYRAASASIKEMTPDFAELYGEEPLTDEKRAAEFTACGKKLEKYFGHIGETLPFYAIGAKSAYKKMLALLKRPAPIKLSRILEVAQVYMKIRETKDRIAKAVTTLAQTIEFSLKEADLTKLSVLLKLDEEGILFEDAVQECKKVRDLVKRTFAPLDEPLVQRLLKQGTIKELKDLLAAADVKATWQAAAKECAVYVEGTGITLFSDAMPDMDALRPLLYSVYGVAILKDLAERKEVISALGTLQSEITEVLETLRRYSAQWLERKYLSLSIYGDLKKLRVEDLSVFIDHVNDEAMKNAAYDFIKLVENWRDDAMIRFFLPFVTGEVTYDERFTFSDVFYRSFYSLVVHSVERISEEKAMLAKMVGKAGADEKEGCGRKHYLEADVLFGVTKGDIPVDVVADLMHDLRVMYNVFAPFKSAYSDRRMFEIISDFTRHEGQLLQNNARLIALSEIKRIAELSKKYDFGVFESNKTAYKNPRLLFKHEAGRITALKRCFIMSPSTVSTLLYGEEYDKFDLVIFDEASQIEPQHMIPALFRAKQCVIIGDEYQMPPMKYFTAKGFDGAADESFDKAVSALDVINRPDVKMRSYVLRCHYRSNSESLIAYSQRYYPEMLTFPSVLSFGKGIGIRDVYVEDGVSVKGVNKREAEEVVKALERHLETTPEASVGVMTFGVAQAEEITRLISQTGNLEYRLFNQYGDERFFVKPIGKLQGKEVDHVIMSMTYSKNENGSFTSFGDLDKSDCGENVFNVAASRARNMLTVIRSYSAADLATTKRSAASYLTAFLRVVSEQAAKENEEEGVIRTSKFAEVASPFVTDVKNYLIKECGVDPARILVNYGVTDKSLRIPIVILDESGKKGRIALFLEDRPLVAKKEVSYVDYAVRYKETLINDRGWSRALRIFAYDWAHYEKEKEIVKDFILQNI